jgi:PKD repeat protein
MKVVTVFSILLVSIMQLFAQSNACVSNRYKEQVFSSVTKTSQVYYGTADPYGAIVQAQDLYVDIYEPTGDTLSNRPVMVYAFGGAFLIGDKNQPPIPEYCTTFAKMGFVVVAIDYRIGFNVVSTESAVRAVYRAAQDLRAAVRFICQRHQQYRIDTASVILTGSSAGCFSGLHSTYFEESQRPLSTFGILLEPADLGCFDCSGNADFGKRLPKIRAIVNHWGAILDTLLIENTPDENCPVISFHGDGDALVPYNSGNPFSYPVFPVVYGSVPIHKRLDNLGIKNKLVSLVGEGHEPWLLNTSLLDTTYKHIGAFLYESLMPKPQQLTGDSLACVGAEVSLIAALRDRSTYCWQVQGSAAASVSVANNRLSFSCVDTGWVTVTVTEKNYLDVASEPVIFKVKVLPKPLAGFSVTANQMTVVIKDSSSNFTSKLWDFGDGFATNGSVNTYSYATPGSYEITQIVANAACADSAIRIVEVDTCPVANFTHQFSSDSLLLFADSSNAIDFLWSISGSSSYGQQAVATLPANETVAISLTVTNKLGCSNSVVQFITNHVSGGVIAVDRTKEPLLYPNPCSDYVIIDVAQPIPVSYTITDMLGSVKLSDRFFKSAKVDVSNLPPSAYLVRINVLSKQILKKIVKM